MNSVLSAMAPCRLCLVTHPASDDNACRRNRATLRLARSLPAVVVHTIPSPLVVHASRHGQYLDTAKRRAYRTAWAKAKRRAK